MAVGRFAPSPTGALHLGNLRTALVAWLFARSVGSAFRLRIEDLDRVASRSEFEEAQRRDLARLGLDHDGEVLRQSDRLAGPAGPGPYEEAIAYLEAEGLTYRCWCTRREIAEAARAPHGAAPEGRYPGTCRTRSQGPPGRPWALRLRVPEGTRITVVDRIAGTYTDTVDDVVLRRNDGVPAYNLAVVIDDAAQGVEEVVRGDDLLASTPRQVLLQRLLGLPEVSYAHVPLVLGPEGRRLAKRDGAVTLDEMAALGADVPTVLGWLGSSLGLCEPSERPSGAAALLPGFDPERIVWRPWRVPPAILGRPC